MERENLKTERDEKKLFQGAWKRVKKFEWMREIKGGGEYAFFPIL